MYVSTEIYQRTYQGFVPIYVRPNRQKRERALQLLMLVETGERCKQPFGSPIICRTFSVSNQNRHKVNIDLSLTHLQMFISLLTSNMKNTEYVKLFF